MIPANVSTTDQRLSNSFFRSTPVQTFPTFMQMNTQQQQQHYPHFPFASLNQRQIARSQRVLLPSYLVPSSNGVIYSPIPQPITEAKSYPYSLPQQQQKQMMENLIHQQHQQFQFQKLQQLQQQQQLHQQQQQMLQQQHLRQHQHSLNLMKQPILLSQQQQQSLVQMQLKLRTSTVTDTDMGNPSCTTQASRHQLQSPLWLPQQARTSQQLLQPFIASLPKHHLPRVDVFAPQMMNFNNQHQFSRYIRLPIYVEKEKEKCGTFLKRPLSSPPPPPPFQSLHPPQLLQTQLIPRPDLSHNGHAFKTSSIEQQQNKILTKAKKEIQNYHRVSQESSKAAAMNVSTSSSTNRNNTLHLSLLDSLSECAEPHLNQSKFQSPSFQELQFGDLIPLSLSKVKDDLYSRTLPFGESPRFLFAEENAIDRSAPSFAYAQVPLQELMLNFTARFREHAIIPCNIEEEEEGGQQCAIDFIHCKETAPQNEEKEEEKEERDEEKDKEKMKRDDRVVYPHSRKRRDHTDLQCFDQVWSPKLLNEDENRMIESSPRSKDIPHMHSIAVDFCGSIDSDLTELDFLLDSHALQHHKKRRRLDSTNTMVRTPYILHK